MDMIKKRQEAARLLSVECEMILEDAEESVFNMDDEQVLSVLGESKKDIERGDRLYDRICFLREKWG
jgi:hypothetical protein